MYAGCVDIDTKRCRRESRRWERENSSANGARSRLEEGFGISIESNGCSIESSNCWSPNAVRGLHSQRMNETVFNKPIVKWWRSSASGVDSSATFLSASYPPPQQNQSINIRLSPWTSCPPFWVNRSMPGSKFINAQCTLVCYEVKLTTKDFTKVKCFCKSHWVFLKGA